MSAQNIITQRDVVKSPQFVSEGITAATYRVVPTNPAFIAIGQDASIVENSNPTVAENRVSGDVDRKETKKVKEVNDLTLSFKVMPQDKAFLQWLINKPAEAVNTPDESRTLLWSYNTNAGVETFQTFRGCKVMSYTISTDQAGFIICEATLSFYSVIENIGGPPIGSGTFATPYTGTPLTHEDGGDDPFTYNSIKTSIETFNLAGTYNMAYQNATGSIRDLYMKPTQRIISGSCVIFKKDGIIQADARDAIERTASMQLSSTITFTFTGFKFMPSGEELKGDTSDATKETKNYEANGVIIA